MGKANNFGKEAAYISILEHVRSVIDITSEEEAYFISLLKYKTLKRRQYILQADDVCRFETYIIKGCMRSYFIDDSGIEHVIMFAVEKHWIGDGLSFLNNTPSNIHIDALEETEVLQIDKPSMDELYIKAPVFERFFRIQFQKAFVAEQQRVICNFTKSAYDRYLTFTERFPNLDQRIAQHQIASFLGITPQFLSQVRSKVLKK